MHEEKKTEKQTVIKDNTPYIPNVDLYVVETSILQTQFQTTRVFLEPHNAIPRAQTNGKAEHFNRTLLSMLRTLSEDKKSRWKDSINKVVHAYNCTVNEATGFLRFYLFGWSLRLPVDLLLGTSSSVTNESHTE